MINVCETDTPCKAGGICQTSEQGNSFSCLCPFGKEGPTCEEGLFLYLLFDKYLF